ncbi:MAG TPA: hypothetical protein VFV50_04350 [Bdellovibrionales bacterium]|nr:hypothetical protein [Bdellovibrionales bacterium]
MSRILKLCAVLSLGACATQHIAPHGTVAMKVSDNVAHAALHDVNQGERVALLVNDCEPNIGPGEGRDNICRKRQVSEGVVTRVLNEHYAEVQFPEGIKVAEGQMLEVVRK